jgi:hypothetical protein
VQALNVTTLCVDVHDVLPGDEVDITDFMRALSCAQSLRTVELVVGRVGRNHQTPALSAALAGARVEEIARFLPQTCVNQLQLRHYWRNESRRGFVDVMPLLRALPGADILYLLCGWNEGSDAPASQWPYNDMLSIHVCERACGDIDSGVYPPGDYPLAASTLSSLCLPDRNLLCRARSSVVDVDDFVGTHVATLDACMVAGARDVHMPLLSHLLSDA